MNWDMDRPIKKGERFNFNWHTIKGYAIAVTTFTKVCLSKKEAKELDTHVGIHYYGEAISHY